MPIVSKTFGMNLAGSAAIAAMMLACGGAVMAGPPQDPQARSGGAIQKGRETGRTETAPAAGISAGVVAGIVVATPAEQTACQNGTAAACRAIEGGMASGAWAWKEGNVMGVDDWARQSARAWPMKMQPRDRAATATTPSSAGVERVLAACDAGDVTACAAFAAAVQPAPAAQRDTRTYTAGR